MAEHREYKHWLTEEAGWGWAQDGKSSKSKRVCKVAVRWLCINNVHQCLLNINRYSDANLQKSESRFKKKSLLWLSLVSQLSPLLIGLTDLSDPLCFMAPMFFQAHCLKTLGSHQVFFVLLPIYRSSVPLDKQNQKSTGDFSLTDLEPKGWDQYLKIPII